MHKPESTRQRARDRGGGSPDAVAVRHWKHKGWLVVVGRDRNRSFVACASQAEAEELADTLRTQIEAGALDEAEAPGRVGELLDRFLTMKADQVAQNQMRKTTLTWVRNACKPVRTHLGEVPIRAVSRKVVMGYVAMRKAQDIAPKTIKGEVNLFGQALRYAVRRGWLQVPEGQLGEVTGRLDLDAAPEKHWLRADEIERFRAAIDDPYYRVAAELAVGAGLRVGEILTRKWKDWNRQSGLLTVGARPEIEWRTKSGKTRLVPLSPDLRRILLEWWMKLGQPGPEAWLLPARGGERRRVSGEGWFSKKTHEFCTKAGVTDVTFHGLRHSFASLALEAGVPLEYVSRILGHHASAFTEKQYVHVSDRKLVAEADRLQAYLETCNQPATGPATPQRKGGE